MERGSITIGCQNISSYIEEKFRRRKLLFQKNSDFEKNSGKRRRRVSGFSVKNFFPHNAETFRGGTLLCFRKFLVSRKVRNRRRRRYHNFPSNVLCLTVPNRFVGEPFSVSQIWGVEKFYA